MNRIRRVLVLAIIGVVIMGFGLISAVDADKPPFMPPDFYAVPGYPDASNANGRIFPGYVYGTLPSPPYPLFNVFDQSDVSFILQAWAYYIDEAEPVDETELFPQPIRVQVWIRQVGSSEWCEVKLSRHAYGNAALAWGDPRFVGPVYRWYAYFEPGYWDVGEYETHLLYTCKDPYNPKERMTCWDTVTGELLDYYGRFLVIAG